ncbi:MAG TPA: aromatic amino acid hydroxylase [Polyangiaceae bacterium]|nr:aromatic amino acid hydroxylase [Polyangiaceae bacterium]
MLSSQGTLDRVPPHLRRLIVQQDYSRYTAIDQAVWRFVLLQTHARLKATAHPAYSEGLAQTGISVEHIPSIREMDEHLAPFGWGAVCVDGFIPPRAFQELQSLSILPIAADMRSAEHLVYTPAPDIIHEAAGHAPILPDPIYAQYLRRIGAAGARAFTLPDDTAVDRAIYALSEVKELPSATPEQVASAERALVAARAGVRRVSEASRLSRLYWWTAEYGLVGSPSDYKLYGAGLLSSLWESFACHEPQVEKPWLSVAAVEVDYDVTRPQPQLFVTPSFERLHDVLDEVVRGLASARGGEAALAEALAAQEIASIQLQGGLELYGRLTRLLGGSSGTRLLVVSGGARADLSGVRAAADGVYAVLGESGVALACLEPGPIDVQLGDGVRLRGTLAQVHRGQHPGTALLVFESGQLLAGAELEARLGAGALVALAGAVLGAHAGAPSDFFAPTELPRMRVPKSRSLPPREGAMLSLYEAAHAALRSSVGSEVLPVFERLHCELERDFKDDWLLRWNLLESLQKLGLDGELAAALRSELTKLEVYYEHQQPIASGLRYLASMLGRPAT